jgi:MarR family transcriptional regulator, negative regulator of the multidrug operon emrRAB
LNFTVLKDGLLTDKDTHDAAAWYKSQFPDTDALTFEAHMSLIHLTADLNLSGENAPMKGGLSRARLNVLRLLMQADQEKLLLSDLSDGLNVTPTNVTRLVDDLVNAELIRRERDPDDRRKTWAVLTDAGRAAFQEQLPSLAKRMAVLWSGLDDQDKKIFIHLIAKLRLQLSATSASERLATYKSASEVGSHPVGSGETSSS